MNSATHFFLGANSGLGFQNLFGKFCAPEDFYDLIHHDAPHRRGR